MIVLEASLAVALLALLAFFSISETSLFSLRPWRVERLRREEPIKGALIARMLSEPWRLLATIVAGTELSTIMVGNLTAMIRRDHFAGSGEAGLFATMAGTSALLLLIGEITPKTAAASYPEKIALRVVRPLHAIAGLLAPLARPLAALGSLFPAGREPASEGRVTEADFRVLVELGTQEGVLDRREADMIGAVLRLGDLPVRAVMIPRTEVLALPASTPLRDALAHIRRHRHSRVPLYQGSLDQIAGILYAKDLLVLDLSDEEIARREARTLGRPAFFVPALMRARNLIREFQGRRLHLAIVVDEYGGTAGIVSLEDLLEEIVGDISDDFDRPLVSLRQVRRGLHWALAGLPFAEFKRRFKARARPRDYDTLGGYVLMLFGRVPTEGDRVSDGQFTYTISRAERRRILELMIERIEPEKETARPGSRAANP